MTFPYDVPLKDLLTFFLFIDFVVMITVGAYTFKTRHKKGKTEQLLEEIRDLLSQNSRGCAEKQSKNKKQAASTKLQKKEKSELATTASTDPEVSLFEVESANELSELNLVKKALTGPRPLTKMPSAVENLLEKTRKRKGPKETPTDTSVPQLQLPPPPPQTENDNTKKGD